jgi:hypothetical protein
MVDLLTRIIDRILLKGVEVHPATIDIELIINDSSLMSISAAKVVEGILDGTNGLYRERKQEQQCQQKCWLLRSTFPQGVRQRLHRSLIQEFDNN